MFLFSPYQSPRLNSSSFKVNHMVPTVYQRFINAVNAVTAELREGGPGADAEMVEVWQPFIAEALALPAQHR